MQTRFIGRSREVKRVAELLDGGARLVTVWGPGGVGKTRLAAEVLRQRGGKSFFCDLSRAVDADGLCAEVARAAGLAPSRSNAVEQIGRALENQGPCLLALDNFEQLVGCAPVLQAWLQAAPGLVALVTSRQRLRLPGEATCELPPLALPAPGEPAGEAEAVRLFVEAARSVVADFSAGEGEIPALVELVRRLDGMPLAIELAASRVELLGLEGLLRRLPASLDELGSPVVGLDERQRSMRGAIAWSWGLLSAQGRRALAWCAVFAGGFSAEDAAALLEGQGVDALAVLQSLRDQSLLRRSERPGAPPRLSMYEGLRGFALEQLAASGEGPDARRRHAAYFLSICEGCGDRDNLIEALRFFLDDAAAEGARRAALRLLLAVEPALATQGPFTLHAELLGRVIAACGSPPVDAAMVAQARAARARACSWRGDLAGAHDELREALALASEAADPALRASLLVEQGVLRHQQRELVEAEACYRAALAEQPPPLLMARVLGNLGALLHDARKPDLARGSYERALGLFRLHEDRRLEGIFVANLALLEQESGALGDAQAHLERAASLLERSGDRRLLGITLANLGALGHERGDLAQARAALHRSLDRLMPTGDLRSEALALARLGAVEAHLGAVAEADALLDRAEVLLLRASDALALRGLPAYRAFAQLARAADPSQREAALLRARALLRAVQQSEGSAPAPCDLLDDVRTALRTARPWLDALAGSLAPALAPSALVVGPDAAWFRAPGGEPQDLRQRRPLRAMLDLLCRRRLEGQGASADELQQAAWPGEKIALEAATNRLRVALAELRKRGLRELLARDGDRYALTCEVRLSTAVHPDLIGLNAPPSEARPMLGCMTSSRGASRSLLFALASSLLACSGADPDAAPASTAPPGAVGAGGAGGASAAGAAGAAGEAEQAPMRLVNLLTGAQGLDVSVGGAQLFQGLGWPAVTPVSSAQVGAGLRASSGGDLLLDGVPSLATGRTTQVALLGKAGGARKVISMLPASSPAPRVRVVNAAPGLSKAQFRLYNRGGSSQLKELAFGDVGDWFSVDAADPSLVGWSLSVDSQERVAYFNPKGVTPGPTTLYVTTSADDEMFVYAVADDGGAIMEGFSIAQARVRLAHAAEKVGPVSFLLDDGSSPPPTTTLDWGSGSEYAETEARHVTVRAVDASGAVLASLEHDLQKFEQITFALVGSGGQAQLKAISDGWSQLKVGSADGTRARFIDARPPGLAGVSAWTRGNSGWDAAWSPFGPALSPGDLSKQAVIQADFSLIGLDFGDDGGIDATFGPESFIADTFVNFFVSRDASGAPWLLSQWPSGGISRRPSAERSAFFNVWNLGTDPLSLQIHEPLLYSVDLSFDVLPSLASSPVQLVSKEYAISLGGEDVAISLEPQRDAALIALPGGERVMVQSPRQATPSGHTVRLFNAAEGELSASFAGAPIAQGVAHGQASPPAALDVEGGLLSVQRAGQEPLSYRVPLVFSGGTTLLAFGGDPAWPTVNLLQPGGSAEVLYPEELSARVRVVAVMNEWHKVDLHVDDEMQPRTLTFPQYAGDLGLVFSVTDAVTLPAGKHTLRLGESLVSVPVDLASGSSTMVLVMPDLSTRLIPLPPEDSDTLTLANATLNASPSRLSAVSSQGKILGAMGDPLASGASTTAPFPGTSSFAAVDVDLDGKPDWRSLLPLIPGSIALVIGSESQQAVVCVKGGWAGVWGKKMP